MGSFAQSQWHIFQTQDEVVYFCVRPRITPLHFVLQHGKDNAGLIVPATAVSKRGVRGLRQLLWGCSRASKLIHMDVMTHTTKYDTWSLNLTKVYISNEVSDREVVIGTSMKRIFLDVLLEHCHLQRLCPRSLYSWLIFWPAFLVVTGLGNVSLLYPGITRRHSCQIRKTMLPDNVIFLEWTA